jgi:hypothetical protein
MNRLMAHRVPGVLAACALGVVLCLAGTARAADSLLIRNATVHTLTGEAQPNTDLLIRDGRIVEIGRGLAAPGGVRVVEAQGRPVTPGIFAGLSRIGLEEIGLESTTGDHAQRLGQMRPEFDVSLAYNPAAMSVGVHRGNGLTFTVLTPGAVPGGSLIAGLGAPVGLDGSAVLPQRILFIDLGGDANDLSGGSRAAQFMLLRQAIVEARSPNLVMVHDERLLSPSGRQVLLDFLKNPGLIVFDVDRAADIRNVIRLVREEKLRAAIRGGSEAWRVASELAAAQIPVILDPFVNLPDSFDDLGATLENAARLRKASVTVAISLRSSEVDDAGKTRQAAGNAVAHGLPWADGLAAITRVPAEIFGIGDRFGSLAVGRTAELVMWSGDPLEISSAALLVLTAGTVRSLDSRHSALRDRYAERVRNGTAR